MQKGNKKAKKKKFGWGYIVGSLVLGAAAMAAMPVIINGLSDMVSGKIKYPVPEDDTFDVEEENEEETEHGKL